MYPNQYCHQCTSTTTLPPEVVVPVCTGGEPCEEVIEGKCVKYTGPDIACLGVTTNMSLDELIQSVAAVVCSTTTTTTTLLSGTIPLAYVGANSIRGYSSSFATARTTGNIGTSGLLVQSSLDSGNYENYRFFMGFDTTVIPTALTGGIRIDITDNYVGSPMQFAVMSVTGTFPADHAWLVADYPVGATGSILSDAITITPGQTGVVNFPFNTAGLDYVNNYDNCSFVLVQYTNDGLNVAPVDTGDYDLIMGDSENVVLYYN